MPIISNKDRLRRILDEEVNKMSKKRYKNMTPNNINASDNRLCSLWCASHSTIEQYALHGSRMGQRCK